MRWLRMLTPRGWTLTVIGIASSVVAVMIGQSDLVWIGLLLLLLPLIAMVMVGRSRMALAVERRLDPARVPLGERLQGTLTLDKSGAWPLGLLQFEEALPRQLGRRPRFTVHRVAGQWERRISYPLLGLERGRYQVGPLLVRATDPFGLAKIDRRFASSREALITPRVVPLSNLSSAGGHGHSGDQAPQKIGLVGSDDVLVREYRAGDDVRRIHWRSTARRDELMVRREEQAWDPTATVFVDNRSLAHAGLGTDSSFEWSVSAATSIALHLVRTGFRVSLFDTDGPLVQPSTMTPDEVRESIVLTMTDASLTPAHAGLDALVSSALGHPTGDLLITVTGTLTTDDVLALVSLRSHRAQGLALVLDTDSFTARRFRSDPARADEHAAAMQLLRRHAWRVVEVTGQTSVDDAWRQFDKVAVSA